LEETTVGSSNNVTFKPLPLYSDTRLWTSIAGVIWICHRGSGFQDTVRVFCCLLIFAANRQEHRQNRHKDRYYGQRSARISRSYDTSTRPSVKPSTKRRQQKKQKRSFVVAILSVATVYIADRSIQAATWWNRTLKLRLMVSHLQKKSHIVR